jgi:alkylated DNA nucleotide flippase Atl1
VLATVLEPDLPWWRVVRADGSLSQGARQRAKLLEEDVPFRPGMQRVDMRAARIPNP